MENEEWKVMDELDGKYSVSSSGRIKNNKTGYVRKPQVNVLGYNRMAFHITRTTVKSYSVHRLVAKYFMLASDKPQINHKDGNKLNNHISNLEWVTPKENSVHSSMMGLAPKGERNGQSKLTEENVIESREMYARGITQGEIALRFNVSRGLIGHVVRGTAWKYLNKPILN